MTELPIDPFVPDIVRASERRRSVIVSAAPGAGKSTRVPPALTTLGRVMLLQPRRVAARSLARRIAAERGWKVGEEVGWQIRFENRTTDRTQLVVATEGVLTARLQRDPFLSDFRVVVLDEFHERSIHADLAIALVRQALEARDDLRLVVMSATLDLAPIRKFLGETELFEVPGRMFPVEIVHRPDEDVAAVARSIVGSAKGDVLCFLPGAREIDAAKFELERGALGARVHRLHGTLPPDEQERALAPSTEKKIILATNIAETSLTIDGVTDVIDSGYHRVLRYDAARALDHLVLERIPRDSAEQRAGRAGRTAPGRAFRLWDARQILEPHREPEIERADLAPTLLEVIAWGADPRTFAWFEAPPAPAVEKTLRLLELLGAVEGVRLTELGRAMHRFSLHPRIARFLLATNRSDRALRAALLLEEGRLSADVPRSSSESDLLVALDSFHPDDRLKGALSQMRSASEASGRPAPAALLADDDLTLRRAILAAFPDRVAQRRGGSDSYLLFSGAGATLSRNSSVQNSEYIVALELGAKPNGEPLIRSASAIDSSWLTPTEKVVEHRVEGDRVRATEKTMFGAIVLSERSVAATDDARAELLAQRIGAQIERDEELQQLVRRARFAAVDLDWSSLARDAATGSSSLRDLDLRSFIPYDVMRRIDREAPTHLEVPSGRRHRLDYRDDGGVELNVKLQELFGLAETPRLGPQRTPVTMLLLAPSGRPVQTTRDLASFWKNTYAEVRKELRGRYPKHPWPEDPMSAEPTHRTKRKG